MEYGSGAPFLAFALAMVCGAFLATGAYVTAGITGTAALIVFGLYRRARDRGDDARHTIW